MLYLTEIPTHRAGYTQKTSLASTSFSQRLVLCILYPRQRIYERLFLSAEVGVREPRGSFPPSTALGARSSSQPPHWLCGHGSSCVKIKAGSPPRASQPGPPSRHLFSSVLCRRKASPAGFFLMDPRARGRVILVSVWPCSPCLHLAP